MSKARNNVRKKGNKIGRISEPKMVPRSTRSTRMRTKSNGAPSAIQQAEKSAPGYREAVLQHVYHFDRDFPDQYRKIKSLPGIKAIGDYHGVMEDDLRFELGRIVYLHHNRYKDDIYFNDIRQCLNAADTAERSLDVVLSKLTKLDIKHSRALLGIKAKLAGKIGGGDIMSLLSTVKEAKVIMSAIRLFLQIAMAEHTSLGRGRPRVPYIGPTLDLMLVWMRLTRQPVVTPKGRTKDARGQDEFSQPCTEFIRLGLNMIDPSITLSNVETCIKKLMTIEKRMIASFGNQPKAKDVLARLLSKAMETFKQSRLSGSKKVSK